MDRLIALLAGTVGGTKRFTVRRADRSRMSSAMMLLPFWCMLVACQATENGANVADQRLTPETPINQTGPLAVPLFETPTGAWTLTSATGSCLITLEPSTALSSGVVLWPDCTALPFQAIRWTLDGAGLVFWSQEGERVAAFRTGTLPPLSGQDAAGQRLTLRRD